MDTTSNHLTAPTSSSFMDATSNPSPPSSSQPSRWDVFLSFYGKDTRAGFIAHLHEALDQAGIQTFRDDPALEKGDEISPALFKAIGSSKKFVVVLSEIYAYSPWCLDELIEILFCKRTKNQVVIPVFYYVNPTDVRYDKESFAKAIDYHYQKKRYSDDMINKWRSALAEIGDLSGYHLRKEANENEALTIKKIVEDVTPPKVLHLDDYLFGIDSAIKEIYEKIDMKSNDVRAIGICGMGGIGKTTTAKAFFNRYSFKFEISCFIENAKQYSLLSLLEQLLIELLRKKDYKVPNIESGIKVLQQILPLNKALIVLDDLEQLELLVKLCNLSSPGNRVILTTRDAHLLNRLKEDISGSVDVYRVKELGEIESMKLFSYHAFRKLVPPESFKELSQKFVSYAEGLPLALKVLGSSLHGRTDISFWKAKLEKVGEIPENKIQKILQLSYDELGDESEKAIFLDIVFFFVGKDKKEAFHVFKSCDFFPEAGIPILVERCLLTIDGDNKFRMHNLIQDMGREVIREETKHGKCRRLYKTWEALQNIEGTDKIEVLILDLTTWTERHLSVKIFERMPNLRLFEIIGAHKIKDVKGNFKNSFHKLRCIRWPHCPLTYLPSDFRPQQLVSLDMPYSKFKTMWKNTMPLTSLKLINISYSENLKRTPDFRDLKLVEKLLFRGCKNLLEVHPSIGQLSNLYHLDLGECYNLKELCEPIGQLTELGHLDLRDCVNLKRLPENIKQLSNLGHLDLGRCRSLKRLPDQLGDMKGLKMIDASDTAIEQLPDSIGRLINLVDLKLGFCPNLTSLPNSIWNLKLLEVLDLGGCWKLTRLPEQLEKLKSVEEIPDSIGLLSRLQYLNLSGCSNLESLPNSLRNLTSLAKLYLNQKDTVRLNLADTVKNMKKLEILHMRCNIRLWLPIILSFSSLKELQLWDEGESFSSTKTFSLSTLSNLRDLALRNCTSLGSSFPELPLNLERLWVQKYATLEQLPDLTSFKQLNYLDIYNCISLQSLPPLPPHLVKLEVHDCTSLQHVPDLSTLKELRTLTITGCSNLKSVSLKESSLQVGRFSSFKADLPNREIPEWLSYKSSGCTISLEIPPILGDNFLGIALCLVYKFKISTHCKHGSYIRAVIKNKTEGITNNYSIRAPDRIRNTAKAISRIECIRRGDEILVKSGDIIKVSFHTLLYSTCDDVIGEVKVKMCGAHVIQTPSTPISSLQVDSFSAHLPNREIPEQLGDMKGSKLIDASDTAIEQLPDSIAHLKELDPESMFISSLKKLPEGLGLRLDRSGFPESIDLPQSLSSLYPRDCKSLTKLPQSTSKLRSLQRLDLSGCTNLADILESIDLHQSLSSLYLRDCKSLTELPQSISKLRSLQLLDLSGCTNLADIPESIDLPQSLLSLYLRDCKSLTKLPQSISKLRSLRRLDLSGCTNVADIPESIDLPHSLLSLYLRDCKSLTKLPQSTSKLRSLRHLDLSGCTNLADIPESIDLPQSLSSLNLTDCKSLTKLPQSIIRLRSLKVLNMSNTHIKSLPPPVFKLIKLEKLLLRRCELLSELPHEIGALGDLKVLDLEGTDLVCLPEELGELFNLKCLRVSLYDAETYRKSKEIVAIIPRTILSKLTQLEELSITVDPHDIWCNAAVEAIMEALPRLRRLKTLKLYLPTTELLEDLLKLKWNTDDFIFQNLSNFNFIIGPHAQRFISRLPCDLEDEFLKLKKCLKYINGEGDMSKFAGALKHANALYLDRHWNIQKLKLEEENELKFCLLVDCNKMQTVFDGSDFNHGVPNKGGNLHSLQYLAIHYLKNLEVIWKGPVVGSCLHFLKVLALHMCPNLNTIFTPVLLGDLVNLKEITIEDCPKIKTLIAAGLSESTSKEILPRLKKLSLLYLPELVSISNGLSIGPLLENVVIYDCPKLKRFSSMGVCNQEAIEIKGESEWWNALEWNESEWSGGQPYYLRRAFSEVDIDEDLLDQLAPQYGNSLHLFLKECKAN